MGLYVETRGAGAPLVMLHGWGMHGGLWGDAAQQLSQDFEVHCIDLPGHGFSRDMAAPFTLDAVVDALCRQFAMPVTLCGWSLGGMIAQRWAAREPAQIRRLVLVASTPCFTHRENWESGMTRDTLLQFASDLEQNRAATLRRFLALQVRGSERERELLARLRDELFSRGEPHLGSLRGGLNILRDADLRGELAQIWQPALVIAGERDKLTPATASHYMARAMPNARTLQIAGAAHAPFLSHPNNFILHLKNFLHEDF